MMLSLEHTPDALSKSKTWKKKANHSLSQKSGKISDTSRLTGADTNSNLANAIFMPFSTSGMQGIADKGKGIYFNQI